MARSDYISREAICLTDFEIAMCNGDYKELCKMLLDKIANVPAADVRPVVRGEWEEDTINGQFWAFYCSECDAYLPYGLEWKPSFCPNCGAEMKGEASDV